MDAPASGLGCKPDRQASDISIHRFELVFESCPVPLLLVREDGRILMTNSGLDRLFDYPNGTLIGEPVDRLVPGNVRPAHARLRAEYLKSPRKRQMGNGRDIYGVTRTGRVFPLELGLDAVMVDGHNCVLVTAIDITEHHAIQAELARRSTELEALNADLRGFARSASHDLKAPLASICGLLSLCLDDIDEGNIAEARDVILEALKIGRRGVEIIESVLGIALGVSSSAVEAFLPETAITEIWSSLTADLADPPQLTLEFDESEPIVADRQMVAMMIRQLLSNACRFADPNKPVQTVRVQIRREQDAWHIKVLDNGIGISEVHMHRVFGAFDRFHPRSGDGIGLTMVRRAAEGMGGSVSFTSREGEGSEFTISLPLRPKLAT